MDSFLSLWSSLAAFWPGRSPQRVWPEASSRKRRRTCPRDYSVQRSGQRWGQDPGLLSKKCYFFWRAKKGFWKLEEAFKMILLAKLENRSSLQSFFMFSAPKASPMSWWPSLCGQAAVSQRVVQELIHRRHQIIAVCGGNLEKVAQRVVDLVW